MTRPTEGPRTEASMCPKCGMVFETPQELERHNRLEHPDQAESA
jgi:hypothetical protein